MPLANAKRRPSIEDIVDVQRYPLAHFQGSRAHALVVEKRRDWRERGAFNLEGFIKPEALVTCVTEIEPLMRRSSFYHIEEHNIYFNDDRQIPTAARQQLTTSHYTLCGDQLEGTTIRRIYEWDALPRFLAVVLGKQALYRMGDPLACLNVMGYGQGDQIGWHFDRAEFTVSLLLQSAEAGGVFQYRRRLRSTENPNYDGVAQLLRGEDHEVQSSSAAPGTLNVFAGHDTAHRITPVQGERMRLIAIFSFMERPDVEFSAADRLRFYGRSRPMVPPRTVMN